MLSNTEFLYASFWLYLDPGTGSFLLQMVMAAILGVGVAIKIYWRKIKSVFGGKDPKENDLDDIENDN
jgi:hypothetical protein